MNAVTPRGRRCSVCSHEALETIERAIVDGASLRALAEQHRLSAQALLRHRDHHMVPGTCEAAAANRAAADAARGAALLTFSIGLRDEAMSILREARAAGKLGVALGAIREVVRCVELAGKLSGALHPDALAPPDPVADQIPRSIQIRFVSPGDPPTLDGRAE